MSKLRKNPSVFPDFFRRLQALGLPRSMSYLAESVASQVAVFVTIDTRDGREYPYGHNERDTAFLHEDFPMRLPGERAYEMRICLGPEFFDLSDEKIQELRDVGFVTLGSPSNPSGMCWASAGKFGGASPKYRLYSNPQPKSALRRREFNPNPTDPKMIGAADPNDPLGAFCRKTLNIACVKEAAKYAIDFHCRFVSTAARPRKFKELWIVGRNASLFISSSEVILSWSEGGTRWLDNSKTLAEACKAFIYENKKR